MARESLLVKLPALAKFLIGTGLFVLFGFGYYFVFYADLASAIQAAQRRERELTEELGRAKQAVAVYQQDLQELHQREQRQGEIEKVLPSEAQYPSFLSSLQSVANVSSVNLVAWNPQGEHTEEFYARVPMRLELAGRYHQVAKFFNGVGQLDRVINIENISMTEPRTEGDDISIKVQVLATAFRSVPDSLRPTDKARVPAATSLGKTGGSP